MKETRISLLLLLSMSLLLLAFVILFIWGFVYYRKAINAVPPVSATVAKDPTLLINSTRDSLQRVFTATINKINAALDSTRLTTDSVQVNMDARLREFYTLKSEIDRLYDSRMTPTQVLEAKAKVGELQRRLDDWRNKYAEVTAENRRLSNMLTQMSQGIGSPQEASTRTVQSTTAPSASTQKLDRAYAALAITDVQLRAITEDSQRETLQALQTGMLQGSFIIKANGPSVPYDEIYVVLQQPDGRVLTQSAWESGSFQTRDGRKLYSYKLRFDYQQGENKRLNFSIEAEQYQAGTYTMQVYHKGVLLARTTKSLS